MSKANWDERFMQLAEHVASWSKDRSTKTGSVYVNDEHRVLSMGYNGFTSGSDDDRDDRHERPTKYIYSEHSERNGIYNATRNGVSLKDSTIYTTFFPCHDCARAIVQCGIKRLVTREKHDNERWNDSFAHSLNILNEAGVEISFIGDKPVEAKKQPLDVDNLFVMNLSFKQDLYNLIDESTWELEDSLDDKGIDRLIDKIGVLINKYGNE